MAPARRELQVGGADRGPPAPLQLHPGTKLGATVAPLLPQLQSPPQSLSHV